MRLSKGFYNQDTGKVARDLLGKSLVSRSEKTIISGKIVETEAYYGPEDPASRATKKKNKINELMWEKPGLALIYMVHGNWLLNITTEKKGTPGAVLIRALEPIEGIEIMKKRRGRDKLKELASGPGKLTQALKITKSLHGTDLTSSEKIYIKKPRKECQIEINSSHRIGVKEDLDGKHRFYINNSDHVSPKY